MKKEWNVTDNMGMTHKIECKVGGFGGSKVIVDNDSYKLKSSNWFIVVIDYQINLPGAVCNLVIIGNKIRLAVNGVFLEDGTRYEPVSNTPTWIWVLVAVSCVGGWFLSGLIGLCAGLIISVFAVRFALEKKIGLVIGLYVANLAIDIALFFLFMQLGAALSTSLYY